MLMKLIWWNGPQDIRNIYIYQGHIVDVHNSIMDVYNSVMDIHNSVMDIHNSITDIQTWISVNV